MPEGIVVWVLVVVMPLDNGVLLTAAREVNYRSDCLHYAAVAKKKYPNIVKHTCTPYEVIRDGEPDGESE